MNMKTIQKLTTVFLKKWHSVCWGQKPYENQASKQTENTESWLTHLLLQKASPHLCFFLLCPKIAEKTSKVLPSMVCWKEHRAEAKEVLGPVNMHLCDFRAMHISAVSVSHSAEWGNNAYLLVLSLISKWMFGKYYLNKDVSVQIPPMWGVCWTGNMESRGNLHLSITKKAQ